MRSSKYPILGWCYCLSLIPLVCGLGGCLGAGDMLVSFPPLQVEGKVVDKDGRGVEGEAARIMLSQRSYYDAVDLVREPSLKETDVAIVDIRTEKGGSFKAEFPARDSLHAVAVVGPFSLGSGKKNDLALLIAVGESEQTLYSLHCHHEKVEVQQIMKQEDGQLETRDLSTPSAVSTELDRSEELDLLRVVITDE